MLSHVFFIGALFVLSAAFQLKSSLMVTAGSWGSPPTAQLKAERRFGYEYAVISFFGE
jgi:hypothetical protein